MILSGTSLQTYVQNLGSFYQRYFADQGVYDTLLHGAEELLQEAYYSLMELVYQKDRLNFRLHHRKLWLPVDLNLFNVTAMESADQVKSVYRIPLGGDVANAAEIPFLSDRIGHPRLLLREGKDYWVDDGALLVTAETYGLLSVDPRIARTEVVANIKELLEGQDLSRTPQALPIPPTGNVYPINVNALDQYWPAYSPYLDIARPAQLSVRLWAPRVELDEGALNRFWGALVDVELDSDEFNRKYIDAILWLFFQGPSRLAFEQCLNMAAGIPLVTEDCVLTNVTMVGSTVTVYVSAWRPAGWDAQTYVFDARYGLREEFTVPGNFGSLILRKGDPLTAFFPYHDDLNDPDWWHGLSIPTDIFDADAYRRDASSDREEFLITDTDPAYIGDPQLYIGADEDGTVNPAVRIKDTSVEAYFDGVDGHPDSTEDYNDFYLKGDAGELSVLPAVGPSNPTVRVLGPHSIVLVNDDPLGTGGGLEVDSVEPRTIRLKHSTRMVNVALGSEARPGASDGEVLGDASTPFRFRVGTAAFTDEMVGALLQIRGHVRLGVEGPTTLDLEGSYYIVRKESDIEIDVVPTNINAHQDTGLYDSYPFPLGRTYGAPNNGTVLADLSGTGTAEVGDNDPLIEPSVGELVLSGGNAATFGGAPPTQIQIADADLDDFSSDSVNYGYYLEIYADLAGTPAWFTARFTLNATDPTKLDVTWVGPTAPLSTSETGLAWRIKRLGSIIQVTSGLFAERNVGDVITLGTSSWGNNGAHSIYGVNTGTTPQQITVGPYPVFLPESSLNYTHALEAGKNAIFFIPVTETFDFLPEHVGLEVDINGTLREILSLVNNKTIEVTAAETTAATLPWGMTLTEDSLVWEVVPILANEQAVRRVKSVTQDPSNDERVLIELDGEPLTFPFPDAIEEWDGVDFPTPDATGQWDKRTLGGYMLEVLPAASVKDESIADIFTEWGAYFGAIEEDLNAGRVKLHLGLINQGALTGVYELRGVHQLPVSGSDGIWWVLIPADDVYSLVYPTWPPDGWANAVVNGVTIPARWEVTTLGRNPGNRFKIGYRLFQNYLAKGTWGYDLTIPDLGEEDTDVFVLRVLEKILEQRPAYTKALLVPNSVLPGED